MRGKLKTELLLARGSEWSWIGRDGCIPMHSIWLVARQIDSIETAGEEVASSRLRSPALCVPCCTIDMLHVIEANAMIPMDILNICHNILGLVAP